MIAIGRYFVFVILITGTILSAHNFSKEDEKQFLNKILNFHNEYRIKHGVGILTLDADLSKSAETIVNKLINKNLHELPKDIGVNMTFVELKDNSKLDDDEAKELFLGWYDTGAGYDYNNEPSDKKAIDTDAFTQIVWKNTTNLGLAIAVNANGYYDVVATYSPPGNQKQQYADNVLRRID